MENTGIHEALVGSHLFSALSDTQLERVRRHSHITDMVEGESLFFQGDKATSFYLMLSGRVKLFRVSPDGKEKVVEIMETGASFAEALMFMDQPNYPVTATALAPSRVIVINCREYKAHAARVDRKLFFVNGQHELSVARLDPRNRCPQSRYGHCANHCLSSASGA